MSPLDFLADLLNPDLAFLPKALAIAVAIGSALLCAWPMNSAASASSSQDQRLGGRARPVITLQWPQFFGAGNEKSRDSAPRVLIPGGQAIGVAIRTQGVLVVGAGDNGRDSLREGDMILSVNGVPLLESAMLTEAVNAAQGQPLSLRISRGGQENDLLLTPRYDESSRAWRLGVWVRDSTAGVGTLTYIDPANQAYGALGHAIVDADTGRLLAAREGAILHASIVGVTKGQSGKAGELKGNFLKAGEQIGSLMENCEYGIYGVLDDMPENLLYPQGLRAGARSAVHTGAASIIATVDADGPQEYGVEIVRCFAQSEPSQKGMILRVTDERLLEKTGGIVQGMSGSPILQDGRIIGAVTHVYLSDATQGYGMYIEWMLEKSDAMDASEQAV